MLQPLQVALKHSMNISIEVIYLQFRFLKVMKLTNLNIIRIIIILIVTLYLARDISRYDDKLLILSLLLIVNLFTFGHLIYDYIVLLPSFVYSF